MKYKLSEIMDIIGGGTPKTSKPEYWNGDIPWLSVKDFNNDYRYVYETEKTITQAGLDNSSAKLLKRNDSIISARGTVGEMAMIPYPMAFNQSCYGLRAKEGLVDEEYLYYLIKHNVVVLKKNTHGSVFDTITRDTFDGIEVELPSLVEQKVVASILRDLDDKIEVNNEINKNLEQQAMAIFNNAIEQSKSVTYVELGSLADVKGGKRLPKGANLMSIPNSHPYIRVRDLNDVVFASLSANYEYVDDETQKTISRYITTTDDVLISIVGTIGLTAIVDKSLNMANLTENCVKVTNLHGISPEYLLLYLRSQHGSEEIKKGTVGAVQAKLPIKNIQALSVPLLPQSDLQSLNDTLKVLFNQLSINVAESKCLTDIRDSLLPKLMSGELDVSNLDL
ncbi:restriction endonuclease subunit S [Anaerovoracaceae bacterium 41-7]